MEELYCPYCQALNEPDDYNPYADSIQLETCSSCGKLFRYKVTAVITYKPMKMVDITKEKVE